MILNWRDDSNDNLIFILFYKHENDENWRNDVLKNICKNDDSNEYRVEYTVPNIQPGEYFCQIQSKCDFGMSELSREISASREKVQVSSVFFFQQRLSINWTHLPRIIFQLLLSYFLKN